MKKENLQKITDLRHNLHMYPELSMQERETAERIKRFLQDNTHFRIVDRGNWFTDTGGDRGDWFTDNGGWFYAFKEGRKPWAKYRRGLRISCSIHDYFPETRNDEQCLEAAIRAAADLGMNVIPMEDMWRASENFGWYLKECPGAIIYIGNGEDYPPLHTVGYDFNDRILENAVDLFAALAENYETQNN